MAVGRGITKSDIDQRAAAVEEQVWSALNEANKLALLLANTNIVTDASLTSLGYSSAEITLLRAAVNDLGSSNGLWGVAHNLKTVPSTNNFFFNGQQITGVNWTG
jgi:hypothetical protein